MAENDIAKIVSLIMENPALVEQIKELAAQEQNNTETKTEATEANTTKSESNTEEATSIHNTGTRNPRRRGELLEALKPYMSDERRRALDSFVAIADILDMMRAK